MEGKKLIITVAYEGQEPELIQEFELSNDDVLEVEAMAELNSEIIGERPMREERRS